MKIQIDPSRLRAKSSDILFLRDELERNLEQIESLVLSSGGSWQGDAARAYASRILFVKKEYRIIHDFFSDYAALLLSIAERYTEHDKDLAAKINLI